MKHTASRHFWQCFEALSPEIQTLARRSFALLRNDPSHTSLQFKAVANGRLHSVRVGLYDRALGVWAATIILAALTTNILAGGEKPEAA